MSDLAFRIAELWERRDALTADDAEARATVDEAIGLLDRGEARVAEQRADGTVEVHA